MSELPQMRRMARDRRAPRPRARRTFLAGEPGRDLVPLEPRRVPAVFASMINNELTVTINDSGAMQNVRIVAASNGSKNLLYIEASDGVRQSVAVAYGTPIESSKLRKITVTGSRLNNDISLAGVNRVGFTQLNGRITVDAGAGNDRVSGSEFNDSLGGGAGNDSLYGFDGNDQLSGGLNDDLLDGGPGDDGLTGDQGKDSYRGGLHFDTIYDFEASIEDSKTEVERVYFKYR